MKNHFSHKGLFGVQKKCFMAIPILSDYKSIDYRRSGSPFVYIIFQSSSARELDQKNDFGKTFWVY